NQFEEILKTKSFTRMTTTHPEVPDVHPQELTYVGESLDVDSAAFSDTTPDVVPEQKPSIPKVVAQWESDGLEQSVREGDVTTLKSMVLKGCDIAGWRNTKGQTLLHLAADKCHNFEELALLLCQSGADVNARDLEGNTPLHLA